MEPAEPHPAVVLAAGPGVPQTQAVIGDRWSPDYQRPTCRGVAGMSAMNRVEFDTAAQAEAARYRRAGDCW